MSSFIVLRRPVAAAFALAVLGLATAAAVAAPAGPFAALVGTWSGAGHVKLDDGKTEGLKCKAYYTPRSGGAALGLALRCASASSKIELRANLSSASGSVSGSWEERSFNAAGTVSGHASDTNMRLSINGGGFSGSMTVTTAGSIQSISVAAQGSSLKGVNITLKRDGSGS